MTLCHHCVYITYRHPLYQQETRTTPTVRTAHIRHSADCVRTHLLSSLSLSGDLDLDLDLESSLRLELLSLSLRSLLSLVEGWEGEVM